MRGTSQPWSLSQHHISVLICVGAMSMSMVASYSAEAVGQQNLEQGPREHARGEPQESPSHQTRRDQQEPTAFGGNMTPIIAALLGASAAGYISHILTRRRERQKEEEEELRTKNQEHREKAGLLKLVHTEITNNLWYLKRIESDGDNPKVAEGLKSDAWEQSRIKLAELVESQQHFEYLVSCYGSLSVLKNRLLQPKTQNM